MHLKRKSRLCQLVIKRAADIQCGTVNMDKTLAVIMTYILLTSFVRVEKRKYKEIPNCTWKSWY